ncbi:MAG: cysteine synthase A [Gammaproteobacteria bacterium]|nr:cysteine synthase A [Gammaproteobacteria bacterium]
MSIRKSLIELIGNTPLIRLNKISEETGCEILGKAEFLNPCGSVKDRTALGIIQAAERNGQLQPGGLIVEGTAGNTGIGLAGIGNALGYKTSIVIPDNQSQEKFDALNLLGVELTLVPAVPYKNPDHYTKVARRLAEEKAKTAQHGAIWANQFDNIANREIHYRSTGPEIWEQTQGILDAFICSVGTGGTLHGVANALREHNKDIVIALADPMGAAIFSHFMHGKLESEGSSITEGIGQARVTGNLEGLAVDKAYQISDAEMLPYLYDLTIYEGLCLGGSTGINIAGAVHLARELGPGHTIVTILADYGNRYQSKLYNPLFLQEKGLPIPPWLK